MRVLLYLFIALFASTPLLATDDEFSDWDTDGDGIIERHEFTSKFVDDFFDYWNTDEDPRGIIEEGFFRESYAGLDTDNDNMLSDEEWLIGYNYFYDDYTVYDDITMIDTDNDGFVEYTEYYDALYDSNYFTDIDLDSDNYISEYELANYVFDNWDTNDSGMISRSEFNQFDWYYLDV